MSSASGISGVEDCECVSKLRVNRPTRKDLRFLYAANIAWLPMLIDKWQLCVLSTLEGDSRRAILLKGIIYTTKPNLNGLSPHTNSLAHLLKVYADLSGHVP